MSWGAVCTPELHGVARPIAKRRAGLLGWVASPNGGINSLGLASGCCPVGFDLDCSLFFGLESKAAGGSVRSTRTNPRGTPLIHALLDCGGCSAASLRAFARSTLLDPELEIVIACLPEGLRVNIPALRFAIGRATHQRRMTNDKRLPLRYSVVK